MSQKGSSFKNSVKETAAEAATRKVLHGCELLPLSSYPAQAVLIVEPVSVSVLLVPANPPADIGIVVRKGDCLRVTKL